MHRSSLWTTFHNQKNLFAEQWKTASGIYLWLANQNFGWKRFWELIQITYTHMHTHFPEQDILSLYYNWHGVSSLCLKLTVDRDGLSEISSNASLALYLQRFSWMFRLNIPCFNLSLLKLALCGVDVENLWPPASRQHLMYWKIITKCLFGILYLRLSKSKSFRLAMRQLRIHTAEEVLSTNVWRFGYANFQKGKFFWKNKCNIVWTSVLDDDHW